VEGADLVSAWKMDELGVLKDCRGGEAGWGSDGVVERWCLEMKRVRGTVIASSRNLEFLRSPSVATNPQAEHA